MPCLAKLRSTASVKLVTAILLCVYPVSYTHLDVYKRQVLDRALEGKGIYPPVNVLPSLSRLMKDGIGAEYTRDDHVDLANQLYSSYAKVNDARSLASVIGEDELSERCV